MNNSNTYNIDELAKFICMGKHSDLPCHEECKKKCEFRGRAKAISDAGYHKTMWHKVVDGDLPKDDSDIIFTIKIDEIQSSTTGWYNALKGVFVSYHFQIVDDVIAWTELPKYEEESK